MDKVSMTSKDALAQIIRFAVLDPFLEFELLESAIFEYIGCQLTSARVISSLRADDRSNAARDKNVPSDKKVM